LSGRTRVWVTTPHFGALAKDNKPVNPYSDIQRRTLQNRAHLQYVSGSSTVVEYDGYSFSGTEEINYLNNYIAGTSWSSDVSGMDNAVKVKALVKVADAKVNVAVALAEAAKTSDLILDTARRIHESYQAFRRGDLKSIAKHLNITPKRLHKSWLEYKYGWLPLLMDVKGAAELFAQQHVVRPTTFTVSAKEVVTKTYSKVEAAAAYGGGATFPLSTFMSCSREVKVKLWCELTSPHLSELQQIGLTNPALVAWELVPFSFVFDWFISVGDWLTGLTSLQGVTIRRGLYSLLDTSAVSQTAPATSRVSAGRTYTCTPIDRQESQRGYTRASYSPDPFTTYPPVNNLFNFNKLVTSLALLRGVTRNART